MPATKKVTSIFDSSNMVLPRFGYFKTHHLSHLVLLKF